MKNSETAQTARGEPSYVTNFVIRVRDRAERLGRAVPNNQFSEFCGAPARESRPK